MINTIKLYRTIAPVVLAGSLTLAAFTTPAVSADPPAVPAAVTAEPYIEKLKNVWVEGGGEVITYGKDYKACAKLCLDTPKCKMIEYYLPKDKCNIYHAMRPRLKGGDAFVGIKR